MRPGQRPQPADDRGLNVVDAIERAPGGLTLPDLSRLLSERPSLALTGDWRTVVQAGADVVAAIAAGDEPVYGVNTGFGLLARESIPQGKLRNLQRRLVRSHAAGVGPALDDGCVHLILALKANALAQGYSGVRPVVVETLLALLEAGAYPVIPAQGSVGASGDLAPLAHLSLALIGEGEIRMGGTVRPSTDVLANLGIAPLDLHPKEGLALLNGTQVSTALAISGYLRINACFHAALVAGALSVDAAKGSTAPFDPRIQGLRRHGAQAAVAARLLDLLEGSEIRESHVHCDRVQDPYSIRCQSQVMGACLEQLDHVAAIIEREANAVTDNPLVFADTGEVLSGGNFHAEPVAMAADIMAVVAAEIGNLSGQRTALLVNPALSGLPPFLIEEAGLNSGFMLAQVTAAALTSENRGLAHPASVDNVPTSADQEDHVSMATHASRRLLLMADNLAGIVAIELLAATQGLDLHAPMKTSPKFQVHHDAIRTRVPFYDKDRPFAPDIEAIVDAILEGVFQLTEIEE